MAPTQYALKVPAAGMGGITVTDGEFGAIDDGLKGYFTVSWTSGQATLTIQTASLSVTVANSGSHKGMAVAVVSFPGLTSGMGIGIGLEWVGKPIAIAGAGAAGGTLVAKVVDFYYDFANSFAPTLKLSLPAGTPLTASVQAIACPCFTGFAGDLSQLPLAVGRSIWISNGGSTAAGAANPQRTTPWRDTIVTVVSAFQVTTSSVIPGPTTASLPGSLVVWGTNNSLAVVNAGLDAIKRARRAIYFPGFTSDLSTGLFCLFDFLTNNALSAQANYNASAVISALQWITADAETFVASATGASGNQTSGFFQDVQHKKGGIPFNAPPPPAVRIGIQGQMHMPRCATQTVLTVVVTGDSWGVQDPSGTGGNDHYSLLSAELQRQNPGKTIHMINRAVSGATWQWFNGAPPAAAVFPSWYTVHGNPWLGFVQTVPVDGLGSLTPDLVVIYLNGNNDGQNSGIYKNDMVSAIATIKSWTTANGLPPDVLLTCAGTKTTEMFSNGGSEAAYLAHEYCTSFVRSFARFNNYGLMDFGTLGAFITEGWAPDALMLRQIPPLAASTATPTAPYSLQLLTRDFFYAFVLGTNGQLGSAFWTAAGTLSISLSPKQDNRLWFGIDGSNNLNICAVAWGLPVTSPCAITNGAGALVTSGQSALTPTAQAIVPAAPSYKVLNNANTYTSGMAGQCWLAPGVGFATADMRSFITTFQSNGIAFICDGNSNAANTTSSIFVGGIMFVPTDATAKADVLLAGAGAVAHILTGANTLVTKVASYASKTSVGLAANAAATLTAAGPVKAFVGSISVPQTYDTAVAAGSDAGANPVLTIQKRGNHIRVGYILGGVSLTNIRAAIQNSEIVLWEGDVECYGGPYIPQVWAGASVTVQCVYNWTGDRDIRMPAVTERELWGSADSGISYPYGGDTSHLSHIGLARLVDPVVSRQNWSMGNSFDGNNAVLVPLTAFSYAVPSNQVFTEIVPAGTLAAGTVTLPAVFPQGKRLEIFSTQTITALTIAAPAGFALVGTAVTTLAAGGTLAYRLVGTNFIRVG